SSRAPSPSAPRRRPRRARAPAQPSLSLHAAAAGPLDAPVQAEDAAARLVEAGGGQTVPWPGSLARGARTGAQGSLRPPLRRISSSTPTGRIQVADGLI